MKKEKENKMLEKALNQKEAKLPNTPVLAMTEKLFCEIMDSIEKQARHDRKCSDAFEIILPESSICYYDNEVLNSQLVKIIQIAMNDKGKESWIAYYIYELDFGKKYKKGCAWDKDGSEIKLGNAKELYEYLIKNNDNNK
jgi:hypothetical protein